MKIYDMRNEPSFKLGYLKESIKSAIIRLEYIKLTNDDYQQEKIDSIRQDLINSLYVEIWDNGNHRRKTSTGNATGVAPECFPKT